MIETEEGIPPIPRRMLDHFPLKVPRKSQVDVINAVEKAFKDGYTNVLLEAPVGSGKSAIAIAAANYFADAHILTPRKSLQNQYYEDFHKEGVVLMKGRGAYPCTYPSSGSSDYQKVITLIRKGSIVQPVGDEPSCGSGPCINSKEAYKNCTDLENGIANFPCPYHIAIDVAQKNDIVIHNLHSFIFQAYFSARFEPRQLLVIDECHEVEGIIRGFSSQKIWIHKIFDLVRELTEVRDFKTLDQWADWFDQYKNLFKNKADRFGVTDQERFLDQLESLRFLSDQFGERFVPSITQEIPQKRTKFEFIPEQVSSLANKYLLSFGKQRLLMSGTIYSKSLYCRNVGLNEEETCFIRIGSSFPKANRPIYFKKDYRVDTSHKEWDKNFAGMITKIKTIMDVFEDAKGLIHTPSYMASLTIFNALRDTKRVVKHDKDNFQRELEAFYASPDPLVFLSPICQQGVDFKGDRARFQIILRVPYLNTSDPFSEYKVKKDFPWYNYQALVTFGQQIGRINRSDNDFGVTVLMDDRFEGFISRNRKVLPTWLTDAIRYE